MVLISDLYELAQLNEAVLSQFEDVLSKTHEGIHHKLAALEACTEELELPDFVYS